MNRRKFIRNSVAGGLALSIPAIPAWANEAPELRFGVAEASYYMRWYRDLKSETYPPFAHALEMLEHCHEVGFGGIQVGIRNWDSEYSARLRKRKETLGMFLEGQVRLPESREDLSRFEKEVRAGAEAGMDIIRTACLSGRRYETFDSREAFLAFRKASENSLRLAEPVMKKQGIKLGVENHKDWRIEEMLEILKVLDSEWVGVTLDTGNNISLLEDPMEVVAALAPYSFSVHLKDMGVEEYEDGFLLSEVNLGEGYLDLKEMVRVIKHHNPDIRFNLEMITRDPLKIPCLTKKYWATFEEVGAPELAVFLQGIRKQKSDKPLPRLSDKPEEEQVKLEVENNRTSLRLARENYGFR